MLTQHPSLAQTRDAFRWNIPDRYNIGVNICDRIAEITPDAPAIVDVGADGDTRTTCFAGLRDYANRMANVLSAHATVGDRIAVLLPQSLDTVAAHIAITKMGCITLPLFTLFGPDALLHRLRDSDACVIVTDRKSAALIDQIKDQLPALSRVCCVDDPLFRAACADAATDFKAVDTGPDDPAILIYTSGTTGNPKGALHAHRVLLGHLPGVEMSHNFLPQPGDVIWTPADWAWIGGLLDVLMPALHHGVPVVANRFAKFDGRAAFDLMAKHGVRNAFLPPTALKIMRQVPNPPRLALRSVASGGETLGAELIAWGQDVFGCTINEFYGQTECNMIVSSCAALAPAEPGVMGYAVPGHDVRIVAMDDALFAPDGDEGRIAVRAPDPVMFLHYWNNPTATAEKFVHIDGVDWLLTGDNGVATATGRIRFVGRDDDIINSSGYRIGPAEIEDCLLTHPRVQMAGVVGKPDTVRGEIVTAFVQLIDGAAPSDALASDIAQHVKARLAAYEYPRDVRFVDAMPMTTTGKIIRADLRRMCRE